MKVGIIGLGLMGGSLAKVLKKKYNDIYIVACNRSIESLEHAYTDKIIDEYCTDINNIFCDCNIIFICTPVSKITQYVNKLLPYVNKDCIITDVGSTKGTLFDDMEKLKDKICFIGGHPMTGSELTKYDSANDYLYENAYYILAPLKSVPNDKIDIFVSIVKTIGAIPIVLSPYEHDFIVAAISHVPHVVAAAIVNLVKKLDTKDKHMYTLAAGGFKDITRIASSSPEMWQNISIENKQQILKVLKEFKAIIQEYENLLLDDNRQEILNYFSSAKEYRDSFVNRVPLPNSKYYEVYVDVLDQLGSIATVSTMLSVNNINIKNIGIINNREFENGVLQIVFDTQQAQQKSIELLQKMNYTVYTRK